MAAHENSEKHQNQGTLHSFVLGVIVGIALTLLFTTKKGRRILRSLTDEGLERVSKWEDLLNKKIDEKVDQINDDLEEPARNASQRDAGGREFVEVVEEPVTRVTEPPIISTKNGVAHHTNGIKKEVAKEAEKEPEVRHTVRRFFKTAKKK